MEKVRLFFAFIFLLIIGCASISIPGDIKTSISEFDGTKEIFMEPAWVCKEGTFGDCRIKLGLLKTSKMPSDMLVLIAVVEGIQSFASGKSLYFNIDGEIVSFASIDELTEFEIGEGIHVPGFFTPTGYTGAYFPPVNWSSKRYLIDKSFFKRILDAQRVAVKIDLGKTYVEGIFSKDAPTLARPAFKNFYMKVFENLNQ